MFPLRDDDPDYPALVMGNYILGSGTLSSRLGIARAPEGRTVLRHQLQPQRVFVQDQRASLTITAIVQSAEHRPRWRNARWRNWTGCCATA